MSEKPVRIKVSTHDIILKRLDELEESLKKVSSQLEKLEKKPKVSDPIQIKIIKKPKEIRASHIIQVIKDLHYNNNSNLQSMENTPEKIYQQLGKEINRICVSALNFNNEEYLVWSELSDNVKNELLLQANEKADGLSLQGLLICCKDNWAIKHMVHACWSNKATNKAYCNNRKRDVSASSLKVKKENSFAIIFIYFDIFFYCSNCLSILLLIHVF